MRTTTLRLAAALMAAALLTAGCSSTADDATVEPAATVAATPTPEATTEEPTPETIERAVGDVVTETEAQTLPEGQTAYPTEAGELVVVDVTQPLPEVLVQEANSTILTDNAASYERAMRTGNASTTEAWRKYNDIGNETGRHVVIVSPAASFDEHGNVVRTYWGAVPSGDAYTANRADSEPAAPTKEGAIAKAEEYISTSTYPEAYQIVVVE